MSVVDHVELRLWNVRGGILALIRETRVWIFLKAGSGTYVGVLNVDCRHRDFGDQHGRGRIDVLPHFHVRHGV
jgi:hypothetical protein